MPVTTIAANDPEVRAAYNDAESLAEFGEWVAVRLFGGTPEQLPAEPYDALRAALSEASETAEHDAIEAFCALRDATAEFLAESEPA